MIKKASSFYAFVLAFFFVSQVSEAVFDASLYSACADLCNCRQDRGKLVVKCRLKGNTTRLNLPKDIDNLDLSYSGLTSIPEIIKSYRNISTLILDHNNIAEIPANSFDGLWSLRHLSLRYNQIYRIENGSFATLRSLKFLNLSMNDLHIWQQSNLSQDTPGLARVDITGSIFWVPNQMLLEVPSLMEIRGATWCKFCLNCTLVRSEKIYNDSTRKKAADDCRLRFREYKFMEIGNTDPKRFFSHGFIPECMCVKETECEFRQLVMPYFKSKPTLPQYLFYLEFLISPLTILSNAFVFLIIATRKNLRRIPAFVLVLNMTVIDIAVAIYSISVAEINIKEIGKILEELMWTGQKLRPSTGPIFIAGQIISVLISSILTIERYIAVIYCTTSSRKLSMKVTLLSLAFAWSAATAFAILPIFGVAGLRYNIKRACAPLSYDVEYQSESSAVLIAMLVVIVVLYFLNIPLYYKIFHFVKKNTGNTSGVKKEVSLARKIAALILTKFIFFAIPIILILIVSIFTEYSNNPFDFEGDAFQSTMFKIIVGQWLPVTCLNINALLDPFLYAFKHSLFKREWKRVVYGCTGKVMPQGESTVDKTNPSIALSAGNNCGVTKSQ